MFTNTNGCTFYEKTVRNRTPAYVRHTTGAVYWEDTTAQTVSGTTRTSENAVLCIIPVKSIQGYVPKPDDRMVSGICADEQPPQTALTVMSVKDFRYGSPAVQHLEVSAC